MGEYRFTAKARRSRRGAKVLDEGKREVFWVKAKRGDAEDAEEDGEGWKDGRLEMETRDFYRQGKCQGRQVFRD